MNTYVQDCHFREIKKDKLGSFFIQIRSIYHQKRVIALLKKALSLLTYYEYFTCYVYKAKLIRRNEGDFTPRVNGFSLKMMSTKQQLNELIKDGFNLASPHSARTEHRLEHGAIACLVFIGKELASVEWASMKSGAKASFDNYPCKVDFSKKEAYAGSVWTNPKYRGNGLHLYTYYKLYDFLRENGIETVVSIVNVHNIAAIKSHDRFAPEERIKAKARYLRLMGLQFWKETPTEITNNKFTVNSR